MFSSLKMPHLKLRSKRNSTGTICSSSSPREPVSCELATLHPERSSNKAYETSDGVLKKIIQVKLEQEDGSFGFALRGGVHADPKFSRPLVVTYVRPGGPADREGTLRPGDCLVAVNNIQLRGATLEEAQVLLNDPCNTVITLVVEYNVNVLKSVTYATGPLYVEVERPHSHELGVKLKVETADIADVVVIESVRPGSTAERCGALHVGDQLLAVGDTSLEDSRFTAAELTSLLHASNVITLHILPYTCQLTGFPQYSSPSHSSSGLSMYNTPRESPQNIIFHRLAEEEPACTSTAIITVELLRDGGPLGLTITGSEEPFEPIVISGLKQGGVADKCSNLQLGDQLLAVNGISVQGKPLSEAILLLQNFSDKVTLKLSRTLTSNMIQGGDIRLFQPSPSISPLSQHAVNSILMQDSYRQHESSNISHVQQVELHQMILYKDPVYEDFGFSVSDGLYERGVFINRIRKGGPADLTNNLKPFDRILQVNDAQTLDYDCCMTVPLIASAGDALKLTITRRVSIPTDESENEQQEKTKYLPWLEEETDEKKTYAEDGKFLHIYSSDIITQPL